VRVLLSEGGGCLDEMLDAEEQLSEQLESLPYLVRFQYEKSRWAWEVVSCGGWQSGERGRG